MKHYAWCPETQDRGKNHVLHMSYKFSVNLQGFDVISYSCSNFAFNLEGRKTIVIISFYLFSMPSLKVSFYISIVA